MFLLIGNPSWYRHHRTFIDHGNMIFFLYSKVQTAWFDPKQCVNQVIWYRKSGNFGHGFILAPKYEVPKLNTPKYVTLQKLTAKIEHCLNIFLYLYSLVWPFCLTSFLSKTLSITVIHVYTKCTRTSHTGKFSRCEIVGVDDKREITGK
jgi:hypothetical protein